MTQQNGSKSTQVAPPLSSDVVDAMRRPTSISTRPTRESCGRSSASAVSMMGGMGGTMGGPPGAAVPDLTALSRGLGAGGGLGKGLGGLLGVGPPNGLPGLGGKPAGKKK